MSGWSLADAEASDVPRWARMIGDWVREADRRPVLHGRAEEKVFVAGVLRTHAFRVARRGADRSGFLARHGGKVQALHAAEATRGPGIGRTLPDEVKAVEPEVRLWTFPANARARAVDRREGFVAAERTDGPRHLGRVPGVWMNGRKG